MYQLKSFEFKSSEISTLLKKKIVGKEIIVNNVKQLAYITENSMSVCYPHHREELVKINFNCLIFCTESTIVSNPKLTFIVTENPKFFFFKFISDYLVTESSYWFEEIISESSEKYSGVQFGYNVKIGKNVIIAPNVKIGSNSIIGNNVVIRSNAQIGTNCIIKDNTIIGSEGFGFMSSEEGLLHIPQIGSIIIGNDVIIGSNCAIEKPALGFTIINNNVKIDDLVQIGHNQEIGENTIITTGFKAEGGVKIGANSFIGMGVTIISKKVSIGNNCLIGAGTVLTKSVQDDKSVFSKQELVLNEIGDKLINILQTKKV